jgi:hypothetical protein
MNKIAIIGATGMLGQPVTHQFINAGFEVSILVRNAEKAKQLFGTSVQIFKGDLSDIDSIGQFLHGQDQLYLNLSVEPDSGKNDFQPEREGLDNILQAIKNSSIKRIAYLSSLVHFYQGQNNFNWWVFDIKKKAVEKIKGSGVAFSIFYPSMFMECFDKGAYRQGNNIMLAGTSKYKMFLIAGNDYGKQVVNAHLMVSGNHEYIIQGQEGYIADDAAKFYIDNYHKTKVKIMKMPISIMKFFGMFTNKFNYGAHIVDALNNYPENFEAEKTWQDLGKPQTKFIDYIKNSL